MKRCTKVCDGGNPCALGYRSHVVHVCGDPDCDCKDQAQPARFPAPLRTHVPRIWRGEMLDLWELTWRIRTTKADWQKKGARR